MSEEESAFYIAIQDPKDFRKELLGASKSLIQVLQRYQNLKKLREEKVKLLYDFSKKTAEITMLVSKLKRAIPKTKLRNMTKSSEVTSKKMPSRGRSGSSRGEISHLQNQLADIERKLGSLK